MGGDGQSSNNPNENVNENTVVPRMQAIQPGMQEAPYYYQDDNNNNESTGDDTNNYGFRVYGEIAPTKLQPQQPQPEAPKMIRSDLPALDGSNIGRQQQYTEPERIQGNSLRTYSNNGPGGSRTDIHLSSQGRPIHANVEMWSGPNNTPRAVKLYAQDGQQYGIGTSFSTSSSSSRPSAYSIRNEGTMEFPVSARVTQPTPHAAIQAQTAQQPQGPLEHEGAVYMQGEGMVRTFPISANVQSVKVILQSAATTTGRRLPCYATVELLQGPNNIKSRAEIYDDGQQGGDAFETILDTPGYTSSLRITNTGPMTYPFHVWVVPHTLGTPKPLANDPSDITQSRFGPDGQFRG